MLKKSVSLLIVFIMALTAFAGIAVFAAATAAPAAPATVNGATYYMNKTFTAKPSGTETLVQGASYTWGCSGVNQFSTDYNALAMTAYTQAEYATAISADGDYVLSLDFMAPKVDFTGTDNTTKGIRLFLGSYFLSTIGSDGALNICTQSTGHKLQAGNWYRLTAEITLPSGDITATVKNLTTNTDVATKSATAAVTSIPKLRFDMPAVTTNPLYTQNWILYKEKAKVPAPAAPADVTDATYYLKNDFTARPSGTVTPVEGVSYTWATSSSNSYDAGYNALGMVAFQKATYNPAISGAGKYVFSLDFMAPDTDIFPEESYASTPRIVLRLGNYDVANIRDNGQLFALCNSAERKNFTAEHWYRLTAEIILPSGDITAKITDLTAGSLFAEASATDSTNLATIGSIIFHYNFETNPLYTQNWRLYKLPNNSESEDDEIEDKVYTTDDFSGVSSFASRTLYDGSAPIKPMTIDDSCLTETISAGNGGKTKSDRIYTFTYDTAPKHAQSVYVLQSGSYTDNYIEFDFKLNDDNSQITLNLNYFTNEAHTANSTIYSFLDISSSGIKVVNNTNLVNPNAVLIDSIEPSQWHRLGVFFSNTANEVVVYYDGTKYTIPVKSESSILKYGARSVRWKIGSKRESMALSIDNLYIDNLNVGTVDYTGRLVNKPALTSLNGAAVESNLLAAAQGMNVAAFKNAIAYTDTTAVRIYKDGTYTEEVTNDDSYVLTSASKLVLSNQEKLFAYYSIGDASSVAITSDLLTVEGSYIHGYAENETVQSLLSKINLPVNASAVVYDKTESLSSTAKVKAGMTLRVTSADNTKSKDYTICNGELFVGSVEYSFSGVNTDGTYSNASIDMSIPVINYTDNQKEISIMVARFNGEVLDETCVYPKSITANFDGKITQTHTDEKVRTSDISYKVFVWDKSSLAPLQKSQLYSSDVAGKKIVVFGDSISAPSDGYATMLANTTGATVINGAVGGARIMDRDDSDSFGQYKLDLQNIVDGLITPDYDWSTQESYKATTNVQNYRNMDLSATDAVIIWMGTNDYGNNVTLAEFEAAAKDVLDKLKANYPNLKIVLASPIYRARMASADGRDCYEYPNYNGDYLYEYGEVLGKLSEDYPNVHFIDLYSESGITKFTNEKYDYLADGLHPHTGEAGSAYKIVNALFAQLLSTILK